MIIAYADRYRQQIVAIRPGRHYELELPWAPDFAFRWSSCAVGGAVSG
jgi:hypothetical protein